MKKCLFIVLLSWITCFASAQSITISEELAMRNDYAYTVLGWIGENLLLFRDRGHEFFIQAFDGDLHLKWERQILLGQRKTDIIGVTSDQDKFHLLFGTRDKGDYILQHRSYDPQITLADTFTIHKVPNIFMTPRFSMVESENRRHVLLFRDINNGIDMVSYDLHARQINWKAEYLFTGGNLRREYSSMIVSNDGECHFVLEPDKFLQRVQQLHVFSSTNRSGEIIQEVVDLGDYQAYDVHTAYDNLYGKLVITGLYSDKNIAKALGFYFLRYAPGSTSHVFVLPFNESLLAEVHGKDVTSSRGLTDFHVKDVALRQDGGAVMIAELNKEFSRRSTLPLRRENGSFTRGGWVDYYYEDLILMAVHPDGTEHWKKVLHKRQYSQDDDAIYSSFFLFKTPSRLRFLFNDEIKQENTVGGYEVTGTGYVERKTVFNTDYQRLKLRFKDGLQVAHNECIVPSERNNRLNLIRIRYD